MRTFNCKYCGETCQSRDKRSVHCGSVDCVNQYNREYYQQKLYDKTCGLCGAPFKGLYRETNCPDCKGQRKDAFVEYTVHDLCIHCGVPHAERTVRFQTDHQAKDRAKGVCPECRKVTGERIAATKIGDKNPNWKGGPKERVYSKLSPEEREKWMEEFKKETSERMKADNPMRRPEVVEKVRKTIKDKVEKGEIEYTTGPKHHLWKGDRKRSFTVRSRLYRTWVKPILERDHFCCTQCGAHEPLEVHHCDTPFRDVVAMFCTVGLESLSEAEFELVSRQIVEYYVSHVKGITLCKECHKKVDPLRK